MILSAQMIKKCLLVWIIVLANVTNSQQVAPKYSNEFLKIGVGAKNLALGSSLTTSTNDVTSVFYNPSAISKMRSISIGAMHNAYFAGIANFDYLGAVFPVKNDQTVGVSFIRFGVDNIPNTLNLFNPDNSINYDNIVNFSIADMALFLTYGRQIGFKGLCVGANAKIINRRYGSFANAWGFGIDLGAQWVKKKYRIGIFAQDLTTTFNTWSFHFTDEEKKVLAKTGNEIPSSSSEITLPSFHFGGQYTFAVNKGKIEFTPSGKLTIFTDKRNVLITSPLGIDMNFGMEVAFWELVMLRMGVGNFTHQIEFSGENYLSAMPSLGLGLKINQFYIDYSYNNVGNAGIGLYSHVFSASYHFKEKPVKDYRSEPPINTPEQHPNFDPNNPVAE